MGWALRESWKDKAADQYDWEEETLAKGSCKDCEVKTIINDVYLSNAEAKHDIAQQWEEKLASNVTNQCSEQI